jgi:tetratricopeptide (TPR) repeat protein
LQDARQVAPGSLELAAEEVFLWRQQGGFKEAEHAADALANSPALNASPADRRLAIARAFARAEDWPRARHFAEQSLAGAAARHACKTRLTLGEIALSEGLSGSTDRFAEARDHFLAVLDACPGHRAAGNNLAWLWTTQFDEPQKAIDLCLSLSGAGSPEEMPPSLIDTLAAAYQQAGRQAEAERLLSRAIALRPDEARLHYRLGLALWEHDVATARKSLEEALRLGISPDLAAVARRKLETVAKSQAPEI